MKFEIAILKRLFAGRPVRVLVSNLKIDFPAISGSATACPAQAGGYTDPIAIGFHINESVLFGHPCNLWLNEAKQRHYRMSSVILFLTK